MEAIQTDKRVESPALEDVLRNIFGMSSTELEMCIVLMERGPMTTAELAEIVDIDRSLVNRKLNHLVDIAVVTKESKLVREGGRVNVYSHSPISEVEVAFERMLLEWMAEALYLIGESMVKEKEEALERANALATTMRDGGRSSVYHH